MNRPGLPDRESIEFDVVIVGGGPAGLSAAIRLKQLHPDFSVVVLEKGAEIGSHILSGAVVDPIGIDSLLPGWREEANTPFRTSVTDDQFLILGPAGALTLPNFLMPPLMSNHGNYIVSLGEVCKWLETKAEKLGVEIYAGFPGTEVLFNDDGSVKGVATGDMGLQRDGTPGPSFARGMELLGKYTILAEGARGSLSKAIIKRFKLDDGRDPPKFGIGLKELWRVNPGRHKPGLVQHTFGWPLDRKTGGGSFLYHLEEDLVAVGFVVHLNYRNPYLSPFDEFQRFKTHPAIAEIFEGGKRLSYGARAISEGGWQSVPKLTFPGGALIGCSAGFVNVPRIKGSHNAVLSGMLAAEHIGDAIESGRQHDEPTGYEKAWRTSPIGKDLRSVRNVKPMWSRLGTYGGIALGGLDMWLNTVFSGWSPLGTWHHKGADSATLSPARKSNRIAYPKPDGVLTFDRLSSVFLSNTNHQDSEPVHLRVKEAELQKLSELGTFDGPSARYCPAGVYEWVGSDDDKTLVVNSQNCVHCKTCDIKDPNQNIEWVPPQGGGGPLYSNM